MGSRFHGRVGALCATVSMGLAACGGGGSSPPPAPTITLTTSATAVEHGQSTALTWQSSNATACSGLEGALATAPAASATSGGGQSSPITRDTTFVLTCTGPGGSASASATVQVLPRVTLTATPQPLVDGSPLTLTWSAPGATSCTRSGMSGGWAGPSATSGSATYQTIIGNGTVLTVSCSSPAGTREASVTIATVRPPPPVVNLTASPASVTSGSTAQLSWSTTNATRCTASGDWSGARSTTGTETVGPLTISQAYQLSCENAVGVFTSANAMVTVTAATASLSGSLILPESMQTDSDVNDPLLTRVSNNTIATAQRVPNPVILGGYVNDPGRGPDGQLKATGDVDDLYHVDLLAGQVVELVIGSDDLNGNDLDLGLYSTAGTLIDASVGTTRVERLIVPANGTYLVRVELYSGASTYTLSIGQRASSASSGPLVSDEFVSHEAVVRTKPSGPVSMGRETAAQALAATHGMTRAAGDAGREMLLRIEPAARAHAMGAERERSAAGRTELRAADAAQQAKLDTLRAIKALARDPGVASAEPNRILRAFAVPNDPWYARQAPHYGLINLPSAWDLTTGSLSVVVAIVDSGVRPHPDLAARLLPGYDFVPLATSGDGDGPDTDASDPGQDAGGGQLSFHGTHVAGTVGAIGNNGLGVSGVAWQTSLMPVRVLGTDGGGTLMTIIQGIRYAARLPNDSGFLPGQRADVMNLSLGGSGSCSPAMQQAISEARAQGTIIVAAAGNNGRDEPTWPAGCAGIVSVASVDLLRQQAPYSNFGAGPSVDVAAPGGDVRVDRNGDGSPDGIFSTHSVRDAGIYYADYTMLQGTSMAAPHVAGVAALLKAVAPTLTPDQFSNLLQSGALTDDIGPVGADSLGVGLINAAKAVRAAATGLPAIPAQLVASPRAVSFGAALTTLDLVVSNSGDGPLSVGSVTPTASWISVAPLSVDGNGLGTYRVTVDRGPLNPGVYAGEIVLSAGVGMPVRVAVLLEKSTTAAVSDGGFQYALLVRTDTLAVVDQVNMRARGASSPFSFSNVPHGTYGLVIGSDLDNDGYICDAGDACGAWPVLARPEPIVVTGPRSGLEVVSSYAGAISAQSATTGLKSIQGSRRGVARR